MIWISVISKPLRSTISLRAESGIKVGIYCVNRAILKTALPIIINQGNCDHINQMQSSKIFVVEWLNKHFSVMIARNSAWSPQQDVDTDRILIDYLRPMVLEMYPKFD